MATTTSAPPRTVHTSLFARPLLGLVHLYQRLTDGRPTPCRFVPTCSNYALDALERHGARRGGWLTVRRLCRCHPWGRTGWDPVPAGPQTTTATDEDRG